LSFDLPYSDSRFSHLDFEGVTMAAELELTVPNERSIKQRLQEWRDNLFSIYETQRIKDKPFVILSNNCWGYELYGSTGREYNTPFIGLFLMPECYLRFLENFEACIASELRFTNESRYYDKPKSYPIGVLEPGIEIHFLHYASEKEARDKWNRRVARMKLALNLGAEIFCKLCDCEGCTSEHLARFHRLDFKYKISIGLQNFPISSMYMFPFYVTRQALPWLMGQSYTKGDTAILTLPNGY